LGNASSKLASNATPATSLSTTRISRSPGITPARRLTAGDSSTTGAGCATKFTPPCTKSGFSRLSAARIRGSPAHQIR